MNIKHYMMAVLVMMSVCFMSSCKDDDGDSMSKAVLASASSLTFQGTGAASQIITVYSDAKWVADVPEWVTVSPVMGTAGATEVTISVPDNIRGGALDNPRKADVVFRGNTLASRAAVTVNQLGDNYRDCKDYIVEQIYGVEDETYMSVSNALVVSKTTNGCVITNSDYKGYMYVETAEPVEVGDNVSLMAQKLSDGQKLAYIMAEDVTINSKNNAINMPEPLDITAKLSDYTSAKREYVAVEGVLSGNVVTVNGASLSLSFVDVPDAVDVASLNGHIVKARGFFAGVASPFTRMHLEGLEDLGEAQTIYLTEDFEWLAPWSAIGNGAPAGQTVEKNADDNALQLVTPKIDGVSAYDAIVNKGYVIPAVHDASKTERKPGAQTYLQTNYLKFGLTGYQCGLTLPSIKDIATGANVHIAFQWCPMVQGSGTKDPTTLVVIVKNGDDEMIFDVAPHGIGKEDSLKWVDVDIELTGATFDENTRITIRNSDDQWPHSSTRRWFLDNIKVYSPMM